MLGVNCYLIRQETGYFLIDSLWSFVRRRLDRQLEGSGCCKYDLKLVILTHGDFDHCGNARYLRDRYGAEIAMHPGDVPMVKSGKMFSSRQKSNRLMEMAAGCLLRPPDRFEPDIYLNDNHSLTDYGFDAQIFSIPGHSQGSIAVFTLNGNLFSGDLLVHRKGKPALNSLIDDLDIARTSWSKLKNQPVKTVYPGHGKPFSFIDLP